MASKGVALAMGVMLGAVGVAQAHDSLQSTESIWVRPTGVQVDIYMSPISADVLVEKKGEAVIITADNFSEYAGRLAEVGTGLLSVSAQDEIGMRADASSASMTEEQDICFSLHYPLPAEGLRELKIHGNYLGKMEEGHMGTAYVLDGGNNLLGGGQIGADTPELDLKFAEVRAVALTKPAATLPANTDVGAVGQWELWCLFGGGLLALLCAGWRMRWGNAAMRDEPGR